jgi:ATP-binding cassette subfamily A (ABC1) protein 3
LRGVTSCYAAIVFTSSPTEGGTRWNYTIRADGNLGPGSLNVDSSTNDHEVYLLPVQHAVDHAIASLDPNITQALLSMPVNEFVYTSISNTQKNTEIREQFENLLINFMAAGKTFRLIRMPMMLI